MLRTSCALLVILAAAIAIACSDSGSTTTVKTLAPGEAGTPRPRPTLVVSTGRPEVDAVIGSAIAKDDISLAGLTGYQLLACVPPEEAADGPVCREDESPGDEVEVLAVSGCDPTWVRPEDVPDIFRLSLATDSPKLLAVYMPANPEGTFGGGFEATAVAVFDTGFRVDESPKGTAFHIKDGRVVWIETDCNDLASLLDPAKVASFIIEPAPPTP